MTNAINRIMTALEGRIFLYGLQLCALFRLLRSINEFSTGQSNAVLIVGLANLIILVLMLTLLSRYKTFCFVTLHVIFLVTSWFTWPSSGGYEGIIPYSMVAMIAFVIFTSHGALLGITLAAYAITLLYLMHNDGSAVNYREPLLLTQVNFMLCTFLLAKLCVFTKNRFERYSEYIRAVSKRLEVSAEILNDQAAQLKIQSNQLANLRIELEKKIAAMHLERDQKRAILSKYAYVNAHQVRGPVARILGLIALIEKDTLSPDSQRYVQIVKSDTVELDTVIRKINEVLSD